jgi:general secretion pathway protein D
VVKTFFLSNADLKETIDLLRIVLGARRVAAAAGSQRAHHQRHARQGGGGRAHRGRRRQARAEVVVEVEILEVNRTRLKEYGIEITPGSLAGSRHRAGHLPRPPQVTTLDDNPTEGEPRRHLAARRRSTACSKTDSSTRLLANPQLRTARARRPRRASATRCRCRSRLHAHRQGGVPQQPVTSFEYKNVGVNIDITPRVHHDGDVTLGLKLEISSLGPLFQNNPTFRSRTSTASSGCATARPPSWPASSRTRSASRHRAFRASRPAVLGQLFTRNRKEVTETDIVMTLTPARAAPSGHHRAGPALVRGRGRGGAAPLRGPRRAAVMPAPARSVDPPRIEPIRPPTPTPTPAPENR